MPDPSHSVIGITDFIYLAENLEEETLSRKFLTEVKTGQAYLNEEPWYRKSRATQALGGLYFTSLPMLLCSPTSYKLLLESHDRKSLYCYPSGHENGWPTDENFGLLIGLLILSNRDFSAVKDTIPTTPVKNPVGSKVIPRTTEKLEQIIESMNREFRFPRAAHKRLNFPSDQPLEQAQSTGNEIFFLTPEEVENAFLNIHKPTDFQYSSVAGETEDEITEVKHANLLK